MKTKQYFRPDGYLSYWYAIRVRLWGQYVTHRVHGQTVSDMIQRMVYTGPDTQPLVQNIDSYYEA